MPTKTHQRNKIPEIPKKVISPLALEEFLRGKVIKVSATQAKELEQKYPTKLVPVDLKFDWNKLSKKKRFIQLKKYFDINKETFDENAIIQGIKYIVIEATEKTMKSLKDNHIPFEIISYNAQLNLGE